MANQTHVPLDQRVASVFVHVTDLRKAAEWYSRLFGLPLQEWKLVNNSPVYWLELEGAHIILDSNIGNRTKPGWTEDLLPRHMLTTSSIEEAYRYVKERAETLSEPEHYGTMANFKFRDPEGNVLMVCWSVNREEEVVITSQTPLLPKIGGVFVDVKDMKAAARWYSELFGITLQEEQAEHPVYPLPVSEGPAFLLDQNRHLNGEDFTELFYIETNDFDASLTFLRENGFELAGEPNYFPNLAEVALLDPDGNRIVVAQMK